LADRARRQGLIGRGTPYLLMMHLFRVVDPRKGFSITLPQRTPRDQDHLPEKRRVVGLADELGVDVDTIWRANRALARSGLVLVSSGSGRTWTRYTVNAGEVVRLLGELPGSPWGTLAVHPGEVEDSDASETPQNAGADPAMCGDRPRDSRGETPQKSGPNARVRAYAREKDPFRPSPPTPASTTSTGSTTDLSPPASGQGPLSSSKKCIHGRTPAQGGCRKCGTTPRAEDLQRAAEERAAATERLHEEQARFRETTAELASKAKPMPPDFRKVAFSRPTNPAPTEEP